MGITTTDGQARVPPRSLEAALDPVGGDPVPHPPRPEPPRCTATSCPTWTAAAVLRSCSSTACSARTGTGRTSWTAWTTTSASSSPTSSVTGPSAKPMGDYSLGGHAATLRDLLDRLEIETVTLVGHSLGGGIAMLFSYLFPERVDRLVLVASGGLGRDVHAVLRSATLPGAEWVLPVLASDWVAVGSSSRAGTRRPSAGDPAPTSPRCGRGSPHWRMPTAGAPSSPPPAR